MLVALPLLLGASTARADLLGRFALRGEAGAGAMLSSYQRQTLGYNLAIQGGARVAFNLIDALAIQAGFASWYFPSSQGAGQQYHLALGPRIEPHLGRFTRVFLDGGLGFGDTSGLLRFAVEAGAGVEFDVSRPVALGVFARYAHLFASSGDFQSDSGVLAGGVCLSLRVPSHDGDLRSDSRGDHDGDGYLDADDLCPREPAGAHPDPLRHGCPLSDRDGDGIADRDDICPIQAAGATPDPARPGCPTTDTDHDGLADTADRCPDHPQGTTPDPERPGCPDGDDDNDHVRNHLDQCPTQHQGLHPDPARPGCPLSDRDNDNVPDAVDACPTEAGAPHPSPRRNGCPGLVRVEYGQIRILRPVFFATNADRILPRSRPVLQAVADALSASPEIRRLSIEGHTDDVGDVNRNRQLSQRRADNVMAFLIQAGVEPTRIEAHGFGPDRPLIQSQTADARATNRRVEFHITNVADESSSSPRRRTP